jgi:hypothetical protein
VSRRIFPFLPSRKWGSNNLPFFSLLPFFFSFSYWFSFWLMSIRRKVHLFWATPVPRLYGDRAASCPVCSLPPQQCYLFFIAFFLLSNFFFLNDPCLYACVLFRDFVMGDGWLRP